jgi:hypothetical protein
MHIPEIDTSRPYELRINGKRYKGRLFNVAGDTVEVYKVRTLADALGKTTAAIEKWENNNLFPKPIYYVKGDSVGICRRWYAREQIINLHNVIRLIPYGRGNGHRHHKQAFFAAIRKVFGHRKLVNVTRKGASDGSGSENRHTSGVSAGTPVDRSGHGGGSPVGQPRTSPDQPRTSSRTSAPYFNPSVREQHHPHQRAGEPRTRHER